MAKKYIIVSVVVIAILVGGWIWLYGWSSNAPFPYVQTSGETPTSTTATQTSTAANSSNASSTGVLFSTSKYAAHAYLISTTSAYNAATQTALDGFQVNRQTLPDGSLQIQLVAQKNGYVTQTYTVEPGESLYFIEDFSGDDSVNEDANPSDDHAILVSADGYIL